MYQIICLCLSNILLSCVLGVSVYKISQLEDPYIQLVWCGLNFVGYMINIVVYSGCAVYACSIAMLKY